MCKISTNIIFVLFITSSNIYEPKILKYCRIIMNNSILSTLLPHVLNCIYSVCVHVYHHHTVLYKVVVFILFIIIGLQEYISCAGCLATMLWFYWSICYSTGICLCMLMMIVYKLFIAIYLQYLSLIHWLNPLRHT